MKDIAPLGRFPGLKASELSPEQVAAIETLVGGRGAVPAPYRFLIASPKVTRDLGQLGIDLRQDAKLTPREREIVILVTATELGSEFVKFAHRRTGVSVGLPDDILDAILAGRTPVLTDDHERTVYKLAISLHRDNPVPQDKAEHFEKMLGNRMVADVIGYIANYTATCFVMRFVDSKPPTAGG